jgi:hypothetical protein
MSTFNIRQSVELFHLILLDQIGRKLDKAHWALKGGCNFRFFFRSPRYSDDMDLDIQGIPVDRLRDKVNAILAGKPLKTILEVRGISIEHFREHQQTETTQRWKFGLAVPGSEIPVPTKIELSRRGLEDGYLLEPVSPEIVRFYGLPPLMANHYPAAVAGRQKIGAILSRTATQARDVFDLNLLIDSGAHTAIEAGERPPQGIDRVKENILSVDFGQFKSQVLSYLEPDLQPLYDSEDIWDKMRWRIIEALGEVRI